MSLAGRIERWYYSEHVGIIDGGGHDDRLADFIREAVVEKIERWKKEHPLASPAPRRRA